MFTAIGIKVDNWMGQVGGATEMVRSCLYWLAHAKFEFRQFIQQSVIIGVDSFGVTAMTSLFTGMVLALQGGTTMASKKLGNLIKEARTEAGLTQEQLARRISGLFSEAERGLKDLTQAQLKRIAQETGVTQASLLNAAKGTKKTTASSSAAKSSMQVTATERRLVELYRQADSKNKKAAMKLLKGEEEFAEEVLGNILEGVADMLTGK